MERFYNSRTLYENRERQSRTYSWLVFLISNVIVELVSQTVISVIAYVSWYYPIGLWRNAIAQDELNSRSGLIFLLIWSMLVLFQTLSQMLMTIMPNIPTGINNGNLLFMLSLIFAGVLVPPSALQNFWIFMYRATPLSYYMSAIMSTGLSGANITCSDKDILQLDPAPGQACGSYSCRSIEEFRWSNPFWSMPITSVSCLLCGARVEDVSHPIPWLQSFRVGQYPNSPKSTQLNLLAHLVYTILENWDEARLSGVGQRRQFEDVIPLDKSVDADIPGIDYESPEIEIRLVATQFGGKYPPNPPLIPQPAWGYEGLFGFPKNVDLFCPGEEPELSLANPKANVYTCDPLNIPELHRILTDSIELSAPHDKCACPNVSANYRSGSDPLNNLPTEILHMILIWMDSKDVANLRLASRVCASLILPEIFWRSRFWEEREFEYVFEENTTGSADGDWRQFFHKVQSLAALPHMANRKRVWFLARHLSSLIDRRQSYNSCNGVKIRTLFEPDGVLDSAHWVTAGPTLFRPTEAFRAGARSLYDRKITPKTPSKRIYVSTMRIKNKIYVTGIRFVYDDDQCTLFGYCKTGDGITPTWEKLQQPATLVGFHVAFDSKGIRGIRFLSVSGELSGWIGDREDLSQRILVLPTHLPPQDLRGGFDALKLVSLSISGGEDTPTDGRSSILLGQIPDAELSSSEVYHMDLKSSLGERITGLEAFYEDPAFIFGLKFYTNRGRAIEFPPDCTDQLPRDEYFSDVLKPEDGNIVGIYAVLPSQSMKRFYYPRKLENVRFNSDMDIAVAWDSTRPR
ncbi:hypothetical protein Daesc_007159 [Daldinia eschscholtzii]|uniref:F-box domain-containing protein n=1 Tax=Daldinia eschscholtzii TaxID=292717 RepID=A0AAX6MDC2_9PEZI